MPKAEEIIASALEAAEEAWALVWAQRRAKELAGLGEEAIFLALIEGYNEGRRTVRARGRCGVCSGPVTLTDHVELTSGGLIEQICAGCMEKEKGSV